MRDCSCLVPARAVSSVGRARASQARGRGFDSPIVHFSNVCDDDALRGRSPLRPCSRPRGSRVVRLRRAGWGPPPYLHYSASDHKSSLRH
eukprot:XP_001708716.1 Hypothetical protein GL50803_106533 [Giardia lamblia ATCC 50803]